MKLSEKPKLIRTATIALSLDFLLKGQLSFLQQHYEVIAVSGEDNHLKEVANREHVRTINISMQRNINLLKDLVSVWQLYVLFKNEKPQIVHSITPKAGLLSMIAAYFARVPIRIHTFTGLIFPSKKGFLKLLLLNMDRVLCLFATHIFPEGQGVKNDLKMYSITKKPLKVIANGNVNGIDTVYFNSEHFSDQYKLDLKIKLGIPLNDFVFIFVGRLVKDKGINELVAAFELLQKEKSTVKLILVGNYESDLDPLESKTLEIINANKSILSVGFQNEVRNYFSIANALVFPSYREGFPNVVLQAGAMNLPSIVTDINGCNEIIQENKNGFIIPVKNQRAIFDAMKKMIANPVLLDEMKQQTREMIVSRYKQEVVWNAIQLEYSKCSNEMLNQ